MLEAGEMCCGKEAWGRYHSPFFSAEVGMWLTKRIFTFRQIRFYNAASSRNFVTREILFVPRVINSTSFCVFIIFPGVKKSGVIS
jgi:hypothetical protein